MESNDEEDTLEENRKAAKFVFAMERLTKSPEWKIFVDTLVKPQIDLRRDKLIEPILNQDAVSNHNLITGEILGLNLAIKLPIELIKRHNLNKEVDDEILKLEKEMNKENSHG